MTVKNDTDKQPLDGSAIDHTPSLFIPSEAVWQPFSITAIGGLGSAAGRFSAILEGQYTSTSNSVTLTTTRYRMSGPYAPKYRANINININRGGFEQQHNSPDTLSQDRSWHQYEVTLSIGRDPSIEPVVSLGIEVDFDGPDGGGWFWTWWTKEL